MTSTETRTENATATPNLRATRKEQAAKTAAAKAPAKKAAPTPAAKAPAKTTATTAAPKLRWTVEGDRNAKGGKEQTARVGDTVYAIKRSGESWVATVQQDGGQAEVLSDGKFSVAYAACVARNRQAQLAA
jgi:hypothetical protein